MNNSPSPEPLTDAPIPTLTPAEHMLNICTLGSSMIIAPANPMGTLGEDVMIAYHKLLQAYANDPQMPKPA